tara:strand:+ start:969 stop:1163 length:195 start_codon:yes stop_codon:yes gene_type:complete
MRYKIERMDGETDDITTQSFKSYDEAYDLLASVYADICCSDADYDDRPYYEIHEIKNDPNKKHK